MSTSVPGRGEHRRRWATKTSTPPEQRGQPTPSRRRLNRGEAVNDLRRFLSFAHRGQVRHRHHDDQTIHRR